MPNSVSSTGIEVKTQAELIAELEAAFQSIYGLDINLDQDSPDGQMMMIFIQAILDLEDLVVEVFNSFDPDTATGSVLDRRVAFNGIQRQAGTYTITNIDVVVDRALNLMGIDGEDEDNPAFTVADDAGNQWKLITGQNIAAPGTYTLEFQSSVPGRVLTIPNTITTPVSIVLGVTSVNNPTTYNTLGVDEESDALLKIRRRKSTTISSQGYRDALKALLLNIEGVTYAEVYENTTGATDANGIPEHSIWVIVAGSAADADIASAIYRKRNAGCGMFGSEQYTITQADDSPFIVKWDEVSPETLHIEFDAHSINGDALDLVAMKQYIADNFVPDIAETININQLATVVQAFDPNCLVTNAGFSLSGGGPFTTTLAPSALNNQFSISTGDITITEV